MKLTILSTSDMHGYIYPTNYTQKNMDLDFSTVKIATLTKKIRKEATGPILLIENGDFIQGSPLSYYIAKNKDLTAGHLTQVLNALNYDCGVLGNHEFNYGLNYLKEAVQSYNYPILAANILDKEGKPFLGKAYEIFEKDGVKVAVLGLVTQYIPHWEQVQTVKDLTFKSAVETAKQYVPMLKELADVVVVSYHGGFERDLETGEPTEALTGENEGYELLKEVQGIDALVTGHQHREIAAKLFNVPLTQPGSKGAYLGKITLELEKDASGYHVVDSTSEIISVRDTLQDEKTAAILKETAADVEVWLDQPLGKVQGDMIIHDPMQARLFEHPYIEFINRVQMEATGASISGTALFNNDGKGFNPVITMRDVITNYIYPNTLAVLKVSGKDLKDALEKTADYLVLDENGDIVFNPKFTLPKPQFYNYDMYEGITYTLDISQPVGNRVTVFQKDGKDILPTDELEIAVNQYRAVGGGNYQMFSADKIIREVQIDMTELIGNYLMKHPIIEATVNHNFNVIN